jgi:hypothetical protein
MIVDILTEITPCKEEDVKANPLMCLFFGGIPRVSTYEAQLVTATIQPGSSGSAVYNSRGEIAGLVFAGAGDLGYAIVVPYEFVANFLENEQHVIPYTKPQSSLSLGGKGQESAPGKPRTSREISQDCNTKPEAKQNPEISKICQIFNRDFIYRAE